MRLNSKATNLGSSSHQTPAEKQFAEWWQHSGQHAYPDVPMMQALDIFTLGWRSGMAKYFRQNPRALPDEGGVF